MSDAGNGVTWAGSTQRVREYRKRKKLGFGLRTIRLSRKEAEKLVELGYLNLDYKGEERAEAIAVEAYLADNLS